MWCSLTLISQWLEFQSHACTFTHTHTHAHTRTCTRTRTHIFTHALTFTLCQTWLFCFDNYKKLSTAKYNFLSRSHTHSLSLSLARTHTDTHTHRHTHTHRVLTCTDGNRLHELLPPGVRADHQRQVGLLNELVHGALPIRSQENSWLAAN